MNKKTLYYWCNRNFIRTLIVMIQIQINKKKIFVISFLFFALFGSTKNVFCQNWVWPTVNTTITSDYGTREHNGYDWHEGIDIRAGIGTDVYAAEEGEVVFAGQYTSSPIIAIHIRHGNSTESRYLHLSRTSVAVGAHVRQGEVIGSSGDSGSPGSPHLDFRLGPPYDNPLYYLSHNAPNYAVTIINPNRENQIIYHISPVVPDNNTELIRSNVNSTTGLDLNKIDVYLNKYGENFIDEPHRINEARTSAPNKLQIDYGGEPGKSAFPTYIDNNGNANRGSTTRTGINPVGDAGDDDFYFIDFNSKIRNDFNGSAGLNTIARYPDGKYTMTIRVSSINGTPFDVTRTVFLDNYFPYVRRLTVSEDKGSGNQDYLYSSHWILDTTSPSPKLKQEWTVNRPVVFGLNETEKTYNVEVQFSEDMKSAEAKIVFKDSTAGSPPPIISLWNSYAIVNWIQITG